MSSIGGGVASQLYIRIRPTTEPSAPHESHHQSCFFDIHGLNVTLNPPPRSGEGNQDATNTVSDRPSSTTSSPDVTPPPFQLCVDGTLFGGNTALSHQGGDVHSQTYPTQEDIFASLGARLENCVLEGYHATLLLLGPQGSGKQHTVMGSIDGEERHEEGLAPRVLRSILQTLKDACDSGDVIAGSVQIASYAVQDGQYRCLLELMENTPDMAFRSNEDTLDKDLPVGVRVVPIHAMEDFEKVRKHLCEDGYPAVKASESSSPQESSNGIIFTIYVTLVGRSQDADSPNDHGNLPYEEIRSSVTFVTLLGTEKIRDEPPTAWDRLGKSGYPLLESILQVTYSDDEQSVEAEGVPLLPLAPPAPGAATPLGMEERISVEDAAHPLSRVLYRTLWGNTRTFYLVTVPSHPVSYHPIRSLLNLVLRLRQRFVTMPLRQVVCCGEQRVQQLAVLGFIAPERFIQSTSAARAAQASVSTTRTQLDDVEALLNEMASTSIQNRSVMAKSPCPSQPPTQTDETLPALISVPEDPTFGCTVYSLQAARAEFGTNPRCLPEGECAVHDEGSSDCQYVLIVGDGIEPRHAAVYSTKEGASEQFFIVALASNGDLFINGARLPSQNPSPMPLHHGDRIIFGRSSVYAFHQPRVVSDTGAQQLLPPVSLTFAAALQERFRAEKEELLRCVTAEQEALTQQLTRQAKEAQLKRVEAEDRVRELEESLRLQTKELNAAKRKVHQGSTATAHLTPTPLPYQGGGRYPSPPAATHLTQSASLGLRGTVGAVTPPSHGAPSETIHSSTLALSEGAAPAPAAQQFRASRFGALLQTLENHENLVRHVNVPPQIIRRYKAVLLGHEEVGKTSLRKCLLSDPLFFKSLPEVLATTKVESQLHTVRLPPAPHLGEEEASDMHLSLMDFAGQEVYHTHSLFLSSRTVFCLVWKMSATENAQMSEYEQTRLHAWLDDILAKTPQCSVVLIGTHMDELRNTSTATLQHMLTRAAQVVTTHISALSGQIRLEGNFAVSCRTRTVFEDGGGVTFSKMSTLLLHLAKVARRDCINDPIYWGGAIPGRHIVFYQEIEKRVRARKRLVLSMMEYVTLARDCGIREERELLELSQLLHAWQIVFLFHPLSLDGNPFIFLHPAWLNRIVSDFFSFSHVLRTPPELRSKIGGLDYDMQSALAVDPEGLVGYGVFLPRLMSVLFRRALRDLLQAEPTQQHYDISLQLLLALEVIYTQRTLRSGMDITTHYIPSLFPHDTPPRELTQLISYLTRHSRHRRCYRSNVLPKEMCFRLQCRLRNVIRHISIDGIPTVRSAWRYACWLGPPPCIDFVAGGNPQVETAQLAAMMGNHADCGPRGLLLVHDECVLLFFSDHNRNLVDEMHDTDTLGEEKELGGKGGKPYVRRPESMEEQLRQNPTNARLLLAYTEAHLLALSEEYPGVLLVQDEDYSFLEDEAVATGMGGPVALQTLRLCGFDDGTIRSLLLCMNHSVDDVDQLIPPEADTSLHAGGESDRGTGQSCGRVDGTSPDDGSWSPRTRAYLALKGPARLLDKAVQMVLTRNYA